MILSTRMSVVARAGFAFVAMLALAPAFAQDADTSQARAGQALADRLCATCHVVSREVGPPFVDIAKGPHGSPSSLRDFLRSTQATVSHTHAMPNPELTQGEIDAVAAYIASLKLAK